MFRKGIIVGLILMAGAGCAMAIQDSEFPGKGTDTAKAKTPVALNFTLNDIDGKAVKLAKYRGNVILMVNVASYCGMTPQYAGLQQLYEKYHKKGFTVLGFPANEFGKQEPGTDKEIKEFCSTKYKVGFPMFSKIVVKGEGQHALYKHLTSKEANGKFGGEIEWNFVKFLLNRKGEVVARIPVRTDPSAPEVVAQIEKLLAEPKP
jgi:glutathione peroxidase